MMTLLIAAIIAIESGGDLNAIGDDGKAYGPLQIHECVVEDVNRVYKTSFIHHDAFDMEIACMMFRLYTAHWMAYYVRQTGEPVTDEAKARCWNGGPKWFTKKHTTDAYWAKVKEAMEKLER